MQSTIKSKARRLATAILRARTAFVASRERPPSLSGNNLFSLTKAILFDTGVEKNPSVHNIVTSTYFDQLPVELISDIFSQVDLTDLLSLRLTSHAFQLIIDENEGAITRRFIHINNLDVLHQLFPPPIIRTTGLQRYSLRYLTQLKKREYICSELSGFLAERIVEQTLARNSSVVDGNRKKKKEASTDATQRVKAILTRQMFFVSYFMSTHSQSRKQIRESLAMDYDQRGITLPPSQTSIISSLGSVDLVKTHHTMTLLVAHMRLATTPEPPHLKNDEWISMLLHQSGMQRIVEFFAADGPKAPRTLRISFMKRMQSDFDELEKRNINDKPPPIRDFWFDAAMEVMKKKELVPHDPVLVAIPQYSMFVNIGCGSCAMPNNNGY